VYKIGPRRNRSDVIGNVPLRKGTCDLDRGARHWRCACKRARCVLNRPGASPVPDVIGGHGTGNVPARFAIGLRRTDVMGPAPGSCGGHGKFALGAKE